jgi:hypothetical protein
VCRSRHVSGRCSDSFRSSGLHLRFRCLSDARALGVASSALAVTLQAGARLAAGLGGRDGAERASRRWQSA